jgi:hypothetical protein
VAGAPAAWEGVGGVAERGAGAGAAAGGGLGTAHTVLYGQSQICLTLLNTRPD